LVAAAEKMNVTHIDRLLSSVNELDASDLHLVAGVPPAFRINGEIILANEDALSGEELTAMAEGLLNEQQRKKLEEEWELCISMHHRVAGRVRATFYRRNGHTEMSLRFCGHRIASREELGLPEKIDELARKPNGLVLVTGPTGAGKTTTLNYLVDLINGERRCKIVTIEDPIEFVHENRRAMVVQQEVLTDVHSFNRALIHVLRQDPDVIVVGEMRDHEAIATALTAAETGHLVLSTIHTIDAGQTINRILGLFEQNEEKQLRLRLADTLRYVISQRLAPKRGGGRLMLTEVMGTSLRVREAIAFGETENRSFYEIIEGSATFGWHTFDQSIARGYDADLLTEETANLYATRKSKVTRAVDNSKKRRGLAAENAGNMRLDKAAEPESPSLPASLILDH
jgi:twitching motility protein PilT